MIVDITGTILTPGNHGKNCAGYGEHIDGNGKLIECCCEECDYFLKRFPEWETKRCGEKTNSCLDIPVLF